MAHGLGRAAIRSIARGAGIGATLIAGQVAMDLVKTGEQNDALALIGPANAQSNEPKAWSKQWSRSLVRAPIMVNATKRAQRRSVLISSHL